MLQMLMDRHSQLEVTMSEIWKKYSDTAESMVQNLKG